MKKAISCSNKDNVIVITIETCSNKNASCTNELEEEIDSDSPSPTSTPPPAAAAIEEAPTAPECPESCPKFCNEENAPLYRVYKLPVVAPRYHGPGCAIEVNILEKHADNCMFKKEDNPDRNPLEDRVGSYECVGRMTFDTCPAPGDVRSFMGGRSTDRESCKSRPKRSSRSRGRKVTDHTVYYATQAPNTVPEYVVLKKFMDLVDKNVCSNNERVIRDSLIDTLIESSKLFPTQDEDDTKDKKQTSCAVSPSARDEMSEETIVSITNSRGTKKDGLTNVVLETETEKSSKLLKKSRVIEIDLFASKAARRRLLVAEKSSDDDAIALRSGTRKICNEF